MKVYLSLTRLEDDEAYDHYRNIGRFANGVMNSEANEIICKDFLSSFSYEEVGGVIDIIISKMRIGCELTIVEPDFYLVSKHIFRESINMEDVNRLVFKGGILKSILTVSDIESFFVNLNLQVVSKHFDENFCRFIIKIRRTQ